MSQSLAQSKHDQQSYEQLLQDHQCALQKLLSLTKQTQEDEQSIIQLKQLNDDLQNQLEQELMKSQRNSLNSITKSLTDQEETIQMKNQTELEISQLRLQLETEKRTSEKFNRSLSEARIQI